MIFRKYPSSGAGRVSGAHCGEWEVTSVAGREAGIRCAEKWGKCVTPKTSQEDTQEPSPVATGSGLMGYEGLRQALELSWQ